jgi:hypothetical protein
MKCRTLLLPFEWINREEVEAQDVRPSLKKMFGLSKDVLLFPLNKPRSLSTDAAKIVTSA